MNLIASIRRALTGWLFARGEHEVSTFEIILWWEKRRVPYNLIVGVAGLFTCAVTVAAIASDKFGEPLSLPDLPISAVLAVIAVIVVRVVRATTVRTTVAMSPPS